MAKGGFKVFDSDMHVIEPADLWQRYIEAPFKDRAPRGSSYSPMDVGVDVDGTPAFLVALALIIMFPGAILALPRLLMPKFV